ncbi:Protoporphyrinogen oxidase [Filimonas lacunae]|uniref:Protoporphyrinogen oxidase n=1 Tax=Filimonas lacunae TaxID=477680 RepID=A0A173MJ65_9BACT|nr:NAD(P)/FAD-dependent oxidoreductase [Filimonas lacunae]BAV07683.1 protoporphyrinogen oxidase [Filimonas lacunae]SIT03476.1 Protoporphyrinogen oxidase [Filimonas lacunae]
MSKKAIIIGAGPAGLTAAWELLTHTNITPVILEKSGDIGGISKTVNYKGNRIDIGGHRFFSKSDRVMKWWLNIMPLSTSTPKQFTVQYHNQTHSYTHTNTPDDTTAQQPKTMLLRKRLSRIYFLRKFFNYPIQLSLDTLQKLGILTTINIILSYSKAQLFKRKETSLEDFLINRFGVKLYHLFFKDYTEKVWGVPCHAISAEWGAQRIKGVSISKAIQHAITTAVKKKKTTTDIAQKDTETSLIEQFLYPQYGPGQLWEEVARQIQEMGGELHLHQDVEKLYTHQQNVTGVSTTDSITGAKNYYEGDYFFSTMPVQELIAGLQAPVPAAVKEVAAGLQYRDFITVGVLLKKLQPTKDSVNTNNNLLPDTWIYIQEKDVKVGRLQIFNNWSPDMVKNPDNVWLGMEYFCNKGDAFWNNTNENIKERGIAELVKMRLITAEDVLDTTVLRVEKTYPAYFGTYERFDEIKHYINTFTNLFLVGRNGMHKYNNSDHSMLTAMVAVDNIRAGITYKENIWEINTEQEYHEVKQEAQETKATSTPQSPQATHSTNKTFKQFLWGNTTNKKTLLFIGLILLLQFSIFKYFYPFAGFINGDSYVYLQAAVNNSAINTYPVGYSKFLRLISVFTTSDTALVAIQYFMLYASILFLLYTLFYFYPISKFNQRLLSGIMIINPVFFYLSNYVSSDTLFISLSITWFTLLLWNLQKPTTQTILLQALFLFLAFTVRYNALYYPIIAFIAILIAREKLLYKLGGLVLSLLLIGMFITYISNKYYQLTGQRQFSPFSGWQLANNAMYGYRYVDNAHLKPVPEKFKKLDQSVRTYFDTTQNTNKYPWELLQASTVYMWNKLSPLQAYMYAQTKDSTSDKYFTGPLKQWATVGPLYASYGSFLIKQYPAEFLQHYLYINALKFYTPPVEFLASYNTGQDSVNNIAQSWFNYTSRKVTTRTKDMKVEILNYLPVISGSLNLLFLGTLVAFIVLKGHTHHPFIKKATQLMLLFWLTNFGFSVFASPVALRFQLFPFILNITFLCLYLEYLFKSASKKAIQSLPAQNRQSFLAA